MPLVRSGRKRLRLGLLALSLAAVPSAWAGCNVAVTGLTTPYVPSSGSATTITGVVTLTCTALSGLGQYTISLGSGGGGSFAGRRMIRSGVLLTYQIYTDSALTMVWGDGTAGTTTVSGTDLMPLLGGTSTFPIYVKVAALQNDAPGTYTDTISDATMTF